MPSAPPAVQITARSVLMSSVPIGPTATGRFCDDKTLDKYSNASCRKYHSLARRKQTRFQTRRDIAPAKELNTPHARWQRLDDTRARRELRKLRQFQLLTLLGIETCQTAFVNGRTHRRNIRDFGDLPIDRNRRVHALEPCRRFLPTHGPRTGTARLIVDRHMVARAPFHVRDDLRRLSRCTVAIDPQHCFGPPRVSQTLIEIAIAAQMINFVAALLPMIARVARHYDRLCRGGPRPADVDGANFY